MPHPRFLPLHGSVRRRRKGADDDTVTITVLDVPPPMPPAAPSNLTATGATANTITLSWDGPPDLSITGYRIMYGIPSAQSSLAVLVNDTATTNTTYTATGLRPGTTYEFAVITLNGSGASPASTPVTVSTEGSPLQRQPRELLSAPPSPAPPSLTIITAASGDVTVDIPPDTAHVVSLSALISEAADSAVLPGHLVITTSYGETPVSVEIPAGTNVTGPPGWDGAIVLSEFAGADALLSIGGLGRITGLITIGHPSGTLAFDPPVRVTFEGRAGDRAAFAGSGADAVLVGETCESGDPALIGEQLDPRPGQCSRDSGGDLKVWTNHFSSIASIGSPTVCR